MYNKEAAYAYGLAWIPQKMPSSSKIMPYCTNVVFLLDNYSTVNYTVTVYKTKSKMYTICA